MVDVGPFQETARLQGLLVKVLPTEASGELNATPVVTSAGAPGGTVRFPLTVVELVRCRARKMSVSVGSVRVSPVKTIA